MKRLDVLICRKINDNGGFFLLQHFRPLGERRKRKIMELNMDEKQEKI